MFSQLLQLKHLLSLLFFFLIGIRYSFQERRVTNDKFSFPIYLCYLVYAPLYIAGPIISFNAFASQVCCGIHPQIKMFCFVKYCTNSIYSLSRLLYIVFQYIFLCVSIFCFVTSLHWDVWSVLFCHLKVSPRTIPLVNHEWTISKIGNVDTQQ